MFCDEIHRVSFGFEEQMPDNAGHMFLCASLSSILR